MTLFLHLPTSHPNRNITISLSNLLLPQQEICATTPPSSASHKPVISRRPCPPLMPLLDLGEDVIALILSYCKAPSIWTMQQCCSFLAMSPFRLLGFRWPGTWSLRGIHGCLYLRIIVTALTVQSIRRPAAEDEDDPIGTHVQTHKQTRTILACVSMVCSSNAQCKS